jgi:cytochrome c553
MMKTIVVTAVALMAVTATGTALAGDAAAGKAKFAVCAGCHGPTGAGNEALKYPKIAGLEPVYIVKQLKAYKAGEVKTPMAATMTAMSAGLSEADMENLAAYIATF